MCILKCLREPSSRRARTVYADQFLCENDTLVHSPPNKPWTFPYPSYLPAEYLVPLYPHERIPCCEYILTRPTAKKIVILG